MAHHRCTGCKRESYPRHKWKGGVYCDDCIRIIRGSGYQPRGFSFFSSIWGKIADLWDSVFRPGKLSLKRIKRANEREVHTRLKAMEVRARNIPYDPQAGGLGKH